MRYAPEQYARAFADVWETTSPRKRTLCLSRFVFTVVKHGDATRIRKICAAIEAELTHRRGGRIIDLEFARPIAPSLLTRLAGAFPHRDLIRVSVRPALLAGVRVVVDGKRQLDYSLRRKVYDLFH